MSFTKAEPVTGFPFGLVDKATGNAIATGTVTIYITHDGGVQFTASYAPVHEGNGQWSANFTGNEMDADVVGVMVTHASAIPQHFTIKTEVASTSGSGSTSYTVTSSGTTITESFTYYGSLVGANSYFTKRLNSQLWEASIINDRESALVMATRAIDGLNYAGDKADSDQVLQFPRGDDTAIPVEIEYACYELALKLLDGADLEQESQTVGVMSESYSGVRTTYDGDYVNDHVRAGILSIEAWNFLKPFLRDPRQVRISRVN
jgi:hypothetical protein